MGHRQNTHTWRRAVTQAARWRHHHVPLWSNRDFHTNTLVPQAVSRHVLLWWCDNEWTVDVDLWSSFVNSFACNDNVYYVHVHTCRFIWRSDERIYVWVNVNVHSTHYLVLKANYYSGATYCFAIMNYTTVGEIYQCTNKVLYMPCTYMSNIRCQCT